MPCAASDAAQGAKDRHHEIGFEGNDSPPEGEVEFLDELSGYDKDDSRRKGRLKNAPPYKTPIRQLSMERTKQVYPPCPFFVFEPLSVLHKC